MTLSEFDPTVFGPTETPYETSRRLGTEPERASCRTCHEAANWTRCTNDARDAVFQCSFCGTLTVLEVSS